ncbi:MAG: DUF3810 domain-containing protein [Clostridia bacterium]|nr:DUF3810 domain-containing protein [Clostridia bacterium]
MSRFKRALKKIFEYIPPAAAALFLMGIVAALLYICFINIPAFADFFNENISSVFRFIFAKLTYIFPFSVAEAVIFASPVLVFFLLRRVFSYMDSHEHGFSRSLSALTSVLVLALSVFVFNFGAGYRGAPLDEKLGFDTGSVSVDELCDTAVYVAEKLNSLADSVSYTDSGSIRGYSHNETVDKAYLSYEKLCEEYDFIQNFKAPVKRLAISKYMTYTHISGVYTFFTGEANLNYNYPEFVNVYTIAHEMAHQRGIARENEANFVAYLVCIGSDDPYMQYSGYLNMFEYLVSAIPSSEDEKLTQIYSMLDGRVYFDLEKYSEFFDKYRDSTASDVSSAINDGYLQSQGTPGERSYGMVVDLAVAYHKKDISSIYHP